MSVYHRRDKPDKVPGLEKQMQDMGAAAEKTVALLSTTFRAQVIADRASGANAITDADILGAADLVAYPDYQDAHAYNHVGEIIRYGGMLFEVVAAHTSNAISYPPATTFAYYRHVEVAHTGALDDPIPYPATPGVLVDVAAGLYYSYGGALYRAAADMPNCAYPPDTPGMWQWERVDEQTKEAQP